MEQLVMLLVEDAKSGILLNAPNNSCTSSLSGLYKSNAWHTEKWDEGGWVFYADWDWLYFSMCTK